MKKISVIALVAPSGVIRDKVEINKKITILSKKFKIKKFYDENCSHSYLADCDNKRARFFESAFLDPEVDLVLSLRGGFGAIRIVDKIDYSLIKDKYFAASSDGSILLAALAKKTNVKCFHSLMVSNGFVENLDKNIEIIENNTLNLKLEPLVGGEAKGVLWGGNLSSLVSLFSGDSYLPEQDIILFLEDLNEPLYKLDKMFYEIYRNESLRSKIKGLIFGDFYFKKEEITPLLKEYAELFRVPAYLAFDITHKINNITIPYAKFVYLQQGQVLLA